MRARMLGKVTAVSMCALALGTPLAIWLVSVRDPAAYLTHSLPPGQLLFVFSKLAALLAICMFWTQGLLGLAPRTPLLRGLLPMISTKLHQRLGLVTAALVLVHVILFITATSYRTGAPAWNLLLPNFTHGYYNALMTFGVIAFWLLALGVFAGWQTARGRRTWRPLHMVWSMVFALGFLHAFAIGSESRYGVMRYLFVFMAVSLFTAVMLRLHRVWQGKRATLPSA